MRSWTSAAINTALGIARAGAIGWEACRQHDIALMSERYKRVRIQASMGANLFNARVVVRFGSDRLMKWGANGAAAAGLWLAVAAWSGTGGLAGLVVPLFLFATATGFVVANSIAGALAQRPRSAGAVSALVGAVQYGSGIVSSALVGAFADGTPRPMGSIIALCAVGCAACAWLLPATTPIAAPPAFDPEADTPSVVPAGR